MKSITQTPTKEIMQIIRTLRELVSALTKLPTRSYFGELIRASKKKIAFLEDFLELRAGQTKESTVKAMASKEIVCRFCAKGYSIPLTAVLSGSGYVKYFRDDQEHVCPFCHIPEEEREEGMIIIRFDK